MLMENNLDLQDDIIAEREKGIAEIQGNMLEINEMFRDLNTIVIEQAPLVGMFLTLPYYFLRPATLIFFSSAYDRQHRKPY